MENFVFRSVSVNHFKNSTDAYSFAELDLLTAIPAPVEYTYGSVPSKLGISKLNFQ